jgi:hypothetical protein
MNCVTLISIEYTNKRVIDQMKLKLRNNMIHLIVAALSFLYFCYKELRINVKQNDFDFKNNYYYLFLEIL